MSNKLFSPMIILLFATILAACNDNNNITLSERSIIYCSEGSPETFNPQLSMSGMTTDATSHILYDTLLSLKGDNNTLTPAIARSWHVTRDGKKVTFYLRKGIKFHSTDYFKPTRDLNADDVVFSFNRILNSSHSYHQVSGGHYPFFQSVNFNDLVEKIEKVNDYTVRFVLKRNDSSFLANLATDYAVILSAEYALQLMAKQEPHNIDILPIGTGPFFLKEYRVGSFIRFYRHNDYWQEKAKITQLVYDISPSKTSRLTKLLAKECDVSSYPIAHEKIVERSDLILEQITAMNVSYLGFNTTKPPFDNELVRQAISVAINKTAIIETIYQSHAQPAKSIIPESSWAYNKNIANWDYDPTLAKSLLAEAGYANGLSMDLWAMPVQRAYNPNALTMAKMIQADLKKVGVKVNIISYEWITFFRRLSLKEHESFLLGWTADHPDPDNFFTPILSCSDSGVGNNLTLWCNDEYDDLLDKALQTAKLSERKKYYTQAMKLIHQHVPLLPIAHAKRYQARDIKVEGNILPSFGSVRFHKAFKANSIDTVDDKKSVTKVTQ